MPKVAVQIWESRFADGRREEVRLDHLSGWVLPYAYSITIGELAVLIEQSFILHHPQEAPLVIRYLKDAPKDDYEGGLLNSFDYASVIFGDKDTVRVYRNPPAAQATSLLQPPSGFRDASVAPNSCAARPSKRLRESNLGFAAQPYAPLAPSRVKRRKIDPEEALESLEEDEPPSENGASRSGQRHTSVVVVNSQMSTEARTNTYGTPQSLTASEAVVAEPQSIVYSTISSPNRSNVPNPNGERPIRRVSTPKSESPDPDSRLVYSVPPSKDATPNVTSGRQASSFVKPGLPAKRKSQSRADCRQDEANSKTKELKTPDRTAQPHVTSPQSDRSRVSSARALSADVRHKSGSKKLRRDIFDVPSDIEESSQTLRKRIPRASNSRQARTDQRSISRDAEARSVTARASESTDSLLERSRRDSGSQLERVDAQEPRLPPMLGNDDFTKERRHTSYNDDAMDLDPPNPSPKEMHPNSLSERGSRSARSSSEEIDEGGQESDLEDAQSREHIQSAERSAENEVPRKKDQEKHEKHQRLEESMRVEREATQGLNHQVGRTPGFSTAHIPTGSSGRKPAIRTPSASSRETPSRLPPTTAPPGNVRRSVSFVAGDKPGQKDSGKWKSPQPKQPEPSKIEEKKVSVKGKATSGGSTPAPQSSRRSYFASLFTAAENASKSNLKKSTSAQKQAYEPKRGSTTTPTRSTKSPAADLKMNEASSAKLTGPIGGRASTVTAKKSVHSEGEESENRGSEGGDSKSRSLRSSAKAQSASGEDASGDEDESKAGEGEMADAETDADDEEESEAEKEPKGELKPTIERSVQDRAKEAEDGEPTENTSDNMLKHRREEAASAIANRVLAKGTHAKESNDDIVSDREDAVMTSSGEEPETDSQSEEAANEHESQTDHQDDARHDPVTQVEAPEPSLDDDMEESASIESAPANQKTASTSVSVAGSRSPAREVRPSVEDDRSGPESESGSESDSSDTDDEASEPTEEASESRASSEESREKPKQGQIKDAANEQEGSSVDNDSGPENGSSEGSESSDEYSESEEEDVMLPTPRASQRNGDTSMMDDAERQIQQEATQSMEACHSTQPEIQSRVNAPTHSQNPASRTGTKVAAISRAPAGLAFPSFTQMLSDSKEMNPSLNNPAYRNPVRKPKMNPAPVDEDSSTSVSSTSASEESDDDLDAKISAVPSKVNKSSNKAKGAYTSLMKFAQGARSK